MIYLLRSKGLYRIATRQETKPTDGDKAAKWENKQDKSWGLIGISITQGLWFHILEIDTLEKSKYCFWHSKWNQGPLAWKWVAYFGPQ